MVCTIIDICDISLVLRLFMSWESGFPLHIVLIAVRLLLLWNKRYTSCQISDGKWNTGNSNYKASPRDGVNLISRGHRKSKRGNTQPSNEIHEEGCSNEHNKCREPGMKSDHVCLIVALDGKVLSPCRARSPAVHQPHTHTP